MRRVPISNLALLHDAIVSRPVELTYKHLALPSGRALSACLTLMGLTYQQFCFPLRTAIVGMPNANDAYNYGAIIGNPGAHDADNVSCSYSCCRRQESCSRPCCHHQQDWRCRLGALEHDAIDVSKPCSHEADKHLALSRRSPQTSRALRSVHTSFPFSSPSHTPRHQRPIQQRSTLYTLSRPTDTKSSSTHTDPLRAPSCATDTSFLLLIHIASGFCFWFFPPTHIGHISTTTRLQIPRTHQTS